MRRFLLACGVLSSLWYVAINVLVPLRWPAYSVVNQTVSELSAIDAPTRALWVAVAMPYPLLFSACGWGVLRSSGDNRALRDTGWLIVFYGAFNLYWPPMHLREVLAAGGGTLSDTLHLTWAGVTTVLFMLIMGFAAVALRGLFRVFTVVSVVLLITFGVLTFLASPGVARNEPTPWIGVWERANIGVFLCWVVAFALVVMRHDPHGMRTGKA
jgi:hypothetical protein